MPPTDRGLAIEARDLVKTYGDVRALDGLDLSVPEGTVLGVLGPNGAGKTTAVKVLTTTLRPTSGEARVFGVDVVRDPATVRPVIGLAGQAATIDGNLTGRENLVLIGLLTHQPRRGVGRRADELLERFGLTEAARRPARTYSGGMRRRLDLAAALVHNPRVLFLDEPTTGLDPASRNDLWETVRELVAGGTTVLLTTQYLEEADRLADRIVVIDRGRAIAEGTAGELKHRLGATVIELVLEEDDDPELGARVLADLGLGEVGRQGRVLRLHTQDGTRALVAAVRALDMHAIEPATAAVREPSLDDVFLALTGRPAEEQPSDDPSAGQDARDDRRRGRREEVTA